MNKRPISGRYMDRHCLAPLPYMRFRGPGLLWVLTVGFGLVCCVLAGQLEAQGAHLVADYGGFQLLEVPQVSRDLATNSHVELRDDHNLILLNSVWLDTTRPET